MTRESKPMELERKKAFIISKSNFDFGKIREAQIVKETPKTFVLDIYGVKWTYRKSEMQTEFSILALTLFEAMRASKMLMERKVQGNIERIRKQQEENKELKARIAEMEAKLSGDNNGENSKENEQ